MGRHGFSHLIGGNHHGTGYETFTKHVFLFLSTNDSIARAFPKFNTTKYMVKLTFIFFNNIFILE